MLYCEELKKYKKALNLRKNNNQKLEKDIIIYRGNNSLKDFEDQMMKGYLEMAELNLEIAKSGEVDIADVSEYETWLCGV